MVYTKVLPGGPLVGYTAIPTKDGPLVQWVASPTGSHYLNLATDDGGTSHVWTRFHTRVETYDCGTVPADFSNVGGPGLRFSLTYRGQIGAQIDDISDVVVRLGVNGLFRAATTAEHYMHNSVYTTKDVTHPSWGAAVKAGDKISVKLEAVLIPAGLPSLNQKIFVTAVQFRLAYVSGAGWAKSASASGLWTPLAAGAGV